MLKESRWKQRFTNFERSFRLLEQTAAKAELNEAERAGLIQFFEMAFELARQTVKDYLQAEGYQVKTPRETLKQAFQIEMLEDGHAWMEALEDRNLTAHTYDEATSLLVETKIRRNYLPALTRLYHYLQERL
ncbi:MAG: nucleotidyltransferase [Chitinivibrionales bacterium]|nr:nucleotidyltransferase [Chitinivibrionales bacterium]